MRVKFEKDGKTKINKEVNLSFIKKHKNKIVAGAAILLFVQNRRLKRQNHDLIHQITLDIDRSLDIIERRLNQSQSLFDQYFGTPDLP